MRPILLVPGICNSGPKHWQSLWEAHHPGVSRVQQRDWDHPVCDEWVQSLDDVVARCHSAPILVAHSLGCLAAARWCEQSSGAVYAVLLVAVPDPAGPNFPADAKGFEAVPASLGGRRATIVSSTTDPYSSPAYTRQRVSAWRTGHIAMGPLGHLNADSGLGAWHEGWAIVSGWREEGA